MANYSYIHGAPVGPDFESELRGAVGRALDDRWKVALAPFEDGGPTYLVTLPGTAVAGEKEAMRRLLAPGEDVGFAVALRGPDVAFRHSINQFTSWAQGRVAEELAEKYGVGLTFDSTGTTYPPTRAHYRRGKTFRDFLLDRQGPAWLGFKEITPDGHW